jgi:SAM-dependent methyltransferase
MKSGSGAEIEIGRVKQFWEKNPVAAAGIAAELGTAEYFRAFDAMREDDGCEPYALSEKIHGYSSAGGLRVLDVGCGNGYVLFQYARNGAEVTGVDLTAAAVDLSRKRFALGGLRGTFVEIDGKHLLFPDDHFDIVCSMGVLHHISNPQPTVDEIYRVLKPDGRLIVMLYHRYSWKNLVLLRLRRLLDPKFRGLTQQEALNMNDGDECPLALVYSRGEAARLFHRFANIEFSLTLLSWKQLFMLPLLVKLAERFLPPSSESWPARLMGWNLNIHAIKPSARKA